VSVTCISLRHSSQSLARSNSATKALGKLQHLDWKDAGEALGRPDLAGVMMPASKAKDMSSTFPQPSIKVEDNWNEVCPTTFLHGSIYSPIFLTVYCLRCGSDPYEILAYGPVWLNTVVVQLLHFMCIIIMLFLQSHCRKVVASLTKWPLPKPHPQPLVLVRAQAERPSGVYSHVSGDNQRETGAQSQPVSQPTPSGDPVTYLLARRCVGAIQC
jgi:hypothetical protein